MRERKRMGEREGVRERMNPLKKCTCNNKFKTLADLQINQISASHWLFSRSEDTGVPVVL